MKQSYLSINFLRLLYNECDLFERLEMENELLENDYIRGEYSEFKESLKELPEVLFSPKGSTIEKVLDYART